MQILSAAEMRQTDERTASHFGVSSLDLMHNAGTAAARFIHQQYPQAHSILVLCGKGNNGGDGFVAVRQLIAAGRDLRLLLLAEPESLFGDAATCFAEVLPLLSGDALLIAPDEHTLHGEDVLASLHGADLLVDAVLGTGFTPPLRGLPAVLRELLPHTHAPIVSIDLPTGWDADSNAITNDAAYRSDAVITFTAPKSAHVFGSLTRGPIVVAPIGSPDAAIQSQMQLHWAGSAKSIAEAPRPVQGNKGSFGHVLVIGGATGKAGAPAMASLAALRSGAGLVTALVPEQIAATVTGFAPELMVNSASGEPGAPAENFTPRHLRPEFLSPWLEKISVLAVGPGLSRHPEAAAFARGLLTATSLPVVLDADGLNAFEGRTDLLRGEGRTLVLTPHPGEMARLAGCTVPVVEADRVALARGFATTHQLTLVLKGWRTLIAHPDGRVAVNTTGNAAMAKGGSGDLLTGIIAALLAQYPNQISETVEAAVCLHGLAGDFAVRAQEEHTVVATDLLAHLWQAFSCRLVDADGNTWLTGAASR